MLMVTVVPDILNSEGCGGYDDDDFNSSEMCGMRWW